MDERFALLFADAVLLGWSVGKTHPYDILAYYSIHHPLSQEEIDDFLRYAYLSEYGRNPTEEQLKHYVEDNKRRFGMTIRGY